MKLRAFLLFSLGLLCAASQASAAATRLFEIFSARFIHDTSGQPILDLGRLTAEGEFKHYIYMQLSAGTEIPPEAVNQNLLPFSIFPAYDVLGPGALDNFKITGNVKVSGQDYFVIAVADSPKLDIGSVVNLSTRGMLSPGGDPLIGGFVVTDHPRRVLIRGIGPSLGGLGVTTPLADPVITLFHQGEQSSLATNDNWGQQANAGEIESAAAEVGAFAVPRASNDAVLLIELPPGVYTARVTSHDASGGTALIEIYLLP